MPLPDDDLLQSTEARLLGREMRNMREHMEQFAVSQREISASLAVLSRLEVNHASFLERQIELAKTTRNQEERLRSVELDMPGLKELRKWVIGGVIAGVGMLGASLIKLVIVDPSQPPRIHFVAPEKP